MEVEKQEMESESQAVESSSTVPPSATADEHPSWQLKSEDNNEASNEAETPVPDPAVDPVWKDTDKETASVVPNISNEAVAERPKEASDQKATKTEEFEEPSNVNDTKSKYDEVEKHDQPLTDEGIPDNLVAQQTATALEVKEAHVNGKDTQDTGTSAEVADGADHALLKQDAAVVTATSEHTHQNGEIQESGSNTPPSNDDDNEDAASVASSAHSEAYESAGEAPEAGDTSDSKTSQESSQDIESPEDLDYTENTVTMDPEDIATIGPNTSTPREQEKAGMCNTLVALPRDMTKYLSMTSDELMKEGLDAFFSNKFMKAKSIFKTKSDSDPLFALGLGSMAFIKAIMTYDPVDIDVGMSVLSTTCAIAQAQIDAASAKRPFKEAVSHYFSSIITQSRTGLPDTPKGNPDEPKTFLPNGVLRAHVVKAEGSLLMGMLHLCQENVTGYLRCGLSIRRAYKSYSLVWQEYKKMGQAFHDHIDKDTVSAIQFGIGSVHLLLSSLPPKVLKVAAAMGWKPDKNLGFALLKLCQEGGGIRSPLASLMLLAYYTILTSIAPQLFSSDYSNPALECLVEAQKLHPDSCFYLLFTGRVSRLVKNIDLSTQSLECAASAAQGEWAESPMKLLTTYDVAMNEALTFDWEQACTKFEYLRDQKYWSPAYFQYFVGACHEITGNRTEAILAFASVPSLIKGKGSQIDKFVKRRVEFFEESGYADLDFSLPALELLLIWNAFPFMKKKPLEQCLEKVDAALELVYERERIEYEIRLTEVAPDVGPPEYYDQRAQALLIKAAVLNALGQHNEAVLHLNWIIDHGTRIKELWVLPFCYWEAGITSWAMDQRPKARILWESGLKFSKYEFDYRMAIRYNVVLNKCDDLGIFHIDEENVAQNTSKMLPKKPTVQ